MFFKCGPIFRAKRIDICVLYHGMQTHSIHHHHIFNTLKLHVFDFFFFISLFLIVTLELPLVVGEVTEAWRK